MLQSGDTIPPDVARDVYHDTPIRLVYPKTMSDTTRNVIQF